MDADKVRAEIARLRSAKIDAGPCLWAGGSFDSDSADSVRLALAALLVLLDVAEAALVVSTLKVTDYRDVNDFELQVEKAERKLEKALEALARG